jgi:hypothetical protein
MVAPASVRRLRRITWVPLGNLPHLGGANPPAGLTGGPGETMPPRQPIVPTVFFVVPGELARLARWRMPSGAGRHGDQCDLVTDAPPSRRHFVHRTPMSGVGRRCSEDRDTGCAGPRQR